MRYYSNFILLFSLVLGSIISCRKPIEQNLPPVNIDRKYCNDPFAINYNDSFPGTPDNSTCKYAYDVYLGTWTLRDSMFKEDSSFFQFSEKDITFSILPSETKNQMNMSGYCSGSSIQWQADKFGKAQIINKLPYPDSAQVVCGGDSVMGYFRFQVESKDTLLLFMTEKKSSGPNLYHKGIATRK